MRMLARIVSCAFVLAAAVASAAPSAPECVFVLHGLARGPWSMASLAERIADAGYRVHNLHYPSRRAPFPELVEDVAAQIRAQDGACARAHFVTYSLGGLLVRSYLATAPPANLGRVVMIAPPNHGSEIVDSIGGTWLFAQLLGPVAPQLGTAADGIAAGLGSPRYPVGVIAGDSAINPVGAWLLPEPNDGTVSVASTKLDGMTDFLVVHRSHTFIMRAPEVAAETIRFLREGRFDHDARS